MIFGMDHTPGAASMTWLVDLQFSMLPLCWCCPYSCYLVRVICETAMLWYHIYIKIIGFFSIHNPEEMWNTFPTQWSNKSRVLEYVLKRYLQKRPITKPQIQFVLLDTNILNLNTLIFSSNVWFLHKSPLSLSRWNSDSA